VINSEVSATQAALHDVRAFVHRYVCLSSEQATLLVIWAAMTHAVEYFDFVPYVQISSPLAECGKTRLLEVFEPLVANPWKTDRVTAAVLMRKIDKEHPTLLLDESDAAFNGSSEEYGEALRGLLNAGFYRTGKASVCVGQGAHITYKDFTVFGPKAIAGIGRLPSTVESRSIPIVMKRRSKTELLEKFRRREGWAEATTLRERLAAAMVDQGKKLREARPSMPAGLSDRAEDVLEPLFAIADAAGGDWPEKARHAAVALMGFEARSAREADQNLSLELLTDIYRIFIDEDRTELATKELIEHLVALEDRPWATFGRSEKAITPHRLSRLLKTFDIVPAGQLSIEGRLLRGYRWCAFEDAFSRYLGFKVLERENGNEHGGESTKSEVLFT
jgi:hypothetical protein